MSNRASLLSALPEEISALIAPEPRFRGKQIFEWLHRNGAADFEQMHTLPKALRSHLQADYSLFSGRQDADESSPDGTRKLRISLSDGERIEAVLLNDGAGRHTACISTQAGCAMGCAFCKTATMGLHRNLTAAEIIEQFYRLERLPDVEAGLDSVVFMGMGEPFMNYEELSRAITILTHPKGRAMSPRRITVSTSGVPEGIRRLADDHPQVRLAVSLVAADPGLRSALMPVEQRNPLPRLKEALQAYQEAGGRRITLEYVLLKEINHRREDADLTARFAARLSCNINLIPWNPATGIAPVLLPDGREVALAEPDEDEVLAFQAALEKRGLTVVLRYKKGRGVNAACGQLATGKD